MVLNCGFKGVIFRSKRWQIRSQLGWIFWVDFSWHARGILSAWWVEGFSGQRLRHKTGFREQVVKRSTWGRLEAGHWVTHQQEIWFNKSEANKKKKLKIHIDYALQTFLFYRFYSVVLYMMQSQMISMRKLIF